VFTEIALALPGERAQFFRPSEFPSQQFQRLSTYDFNTSKPTLGCYLVPRPSPRFQPTLLLPAPWKIHWDLEGAKADFGLLFDEGMSFLSAGLCQKIVPSVGIKGSWSGDWEGGLEGFRRRFMEPSHFYRHGLFSSERLSLGNSPELLLAKNPGDRFLESRALAGSSPNATSWSPKLHEEHRWVLEDIQQQLVDLGEVEALPQRVISAGTSLFHLETPIRLYPQQSLSAEDCIARLHPTAALGVLPRNSVPLKKLYRGSFPRGDFGAPLCWQTSQEAFTVWVRIRCIEFFRSGECRCVVGAGLVPGSQLSEEWAEIRNKFRSTLQALGLLEGQERGSL